LGPVSWLASAATENHWKPQLLLLMLLLIS